MALIDYFMPLMAYVRALDTQDERALDERAHDIDALISQAQNLALKDGVELAQFQDALFPVLAWVDERMARLRHGDGHEHSWQRHLLQRRYFKTGLAGREFFDRLAQLGPSDTAVREVYLYCLCLGFLGRYSVSPNTAELTRLRLDQYQQLQQADRSFASLDGDILFPQAYGSTADTPQAPGRRSTRRRLSTGRLLLFVLPPLILLLIALGLHAELTASVQRFREVFDL